ncbi:MAG: Uma2 family endonuclease [Chitinophagaceae bacterium]|jgi:Uma2 family endonuclease|nr:Uma2 family endonuclease [Chitinophagaceae bacterium]
MVLDINELDLSKRYTYADYLTWGFKERVELIRGWIIKMSPAPIDQHQRITTALSSEIYQYFKKKRCQVRAAPYDVRLLDSKKSTDDDQIYTVVQPDISVICDAAKIDRRGCIGAPDWIIEILLPGNTKTEMQDKYNLYEENGVKEYWIVQPEYAAIQQFVLNDGSKFQLEKMVSGNAILASSCFPELKIELEGIF